MRSGTPAHELPCALPSARLASSKRQLAVQHRTRAGRAGGAYRPAPGRDSCVRSTGTRLLALTSQNLAPIWLPHCEGTEGHVEAHG